MYYDPEGLAYAEEVNVNRDINITQSWHEYMYDYCFYRCHCHVHARVSTVCVLYGHLSARQRQRCQHQDNIQPANRKKH